MTFKFSPVMLKAIHRELFTGVLSEEITGEWKNCNLTKAEAVLGGAEAFSMRTGMRYRIILVMISRKREAAGINIHLGRRRFRDSQDLFRESGRRIRSEMEM